MANSIVAGNFTDGGVRNDITGTITLSNGHNVFGSDVKGNVPGDREKVAPSTIFATIDPGTGGGKLDSRGVVPLKKNLLSNPALSGADPLTASATGQLGTTLRPLPAGSLPDIGAVEADQPLSTSPTANNDVLIGSAAANNLAGLAGNDYLKGLGGNDVVMGGPGSDVLDGGTGSNRLNGGTGVDLASFAFSPVAVAIDLIGTTDTARRGGEADQLTSIEGAIGTIKADSFKGDAGNNEFQGGLAKDRYTGGGGRDLYDFNAVVDSPAGAQRDVIADFASGQDVIDLAGVDADGAPPGDQSFRWVGKANVTGAAQLGYFVSGGMTIVRASTDADAAAELEIQLTGTKTLTAGDFRP